MQLGFVAFHIAYIMGRNRLAIVLAFSLVALQSAAVTIHRSFRTREAGFGFGTGTAGVAYPVDAKIDKAIDEARQKEAEKIKVIIGKVTRVSYGDTIHVVTDGNEKFKVRLNRIDAPEKDQPFGKESTEYLSKLIRGKTVRVEYDSKDQYGRILGIVYLEKSSNPNNRTIRQDINLEMVATGHAHHYSHFDQTPAYIAAESAAKEQKLGLWASDNVVSPYEWRKNKRRM